MVKLTPYLVSISLLQDNLEIAVLSEGPFVQYYFTDTITKIDSCVMVPLPESIMQEVDCNTELQSKIIQIVQHALESSTNPDDILDDLEREINVLIFDSLSIKQSLQALETTVTGCMESVRQNILKSDDVIRNLILQNN
jgi:hypothetical protein